jgi:Fe2+ transport system protein B
LGLSGSNQIILAGTPNSGKTSIFNRLTGLRQKVANYPGVTVEKHTGHCKYGTKDYLVHDLPGCYSLYPVSSDERVVLDTLLEQSISGQKDTVIVVLNAAQLQRSLLLLSQIVDLGFPVVAALNMNDTALEESKVIQVDKLKSVLKVPLVEVNGRTGNGVNELLALIDSKGVAVRSPFISETHYKLTTVEHIQEYVGLDTLYGAYLLCCQAGRSSLLTLEAFQAAKDSAEFFGLRKEVEDKQERILTIKTLNWGRNEGRRRKSFCPTSGLGLDSQGVGLSHIPFGSVPPFPIGVRLGKSDDGRYRRGLCLDVTRHFRHPS